MLRDTFEALSKDMANKAGDNIHKVCMRAYDALTEDEKKSLDNPDKPLHIVRAIGAVFGPNAALVTYEVAGTESLAKRVKRFLRQRNI